MHTPIAPTPLPGTPGQQELMRAIVAYYADDPRILAICIFGSIGRGNWDEYSDLDLDIVVADGITVDADEELHALCASFAAIGDRALIVLPDEDEGDVVLASLRELSVRYHPLATTKPAIIDGLIVLAGPLGAETIRAAGRANAEAAPPPLARLLDECVRLLLGVDTCLRRRQFWRAVQMLQLARGVLFQMFAQAHNHPRPFHAFQTLASPELQARLGETLPGHNLESAQEAFERMVTLVEHDLVELTAGQVMLTEEQREVIARMRGR